MSLTTPLPNDAGTTDKVTVTNDGCTPRATKLTAGHFKNPSIVSPQCFPTSWTTVDDSSFATVNEIHGWEATCEPVYYWYNAPPGFQVDPMMEIVPGSFRRVVSP
jgi:hypothetical protein